MSTKVYPKPIQLSLLGINATHESSYTVDRKVGSDGFLLEFFESPVVLEDADGRKHYTGKVFILYAPGQRQYFRAEGPLTHTWFQMTGEGVADCIERYHIPVNQAIEVEDLDFLAPMLQEATRQKVRKHRYWEDAMTELFRSLFRRLARSLFDRDWVNESPYRRHLLATMHTVRAQVYKDLQRRWTVDDMAALASMSVQRFAVAYRECFGTGPIDDLIDVRIRHADLLLKHLPITVVDAAHHSGFNTGSNFHVLFRERMGRSPRGQARTSERLLAAAAAETDLFETSEAARQAHLFYIRPVGYWSFDQDEPEVMDDLLKHSAAALHNGVVKVPGRDGGRALKFDGSGYAVIPEAVLDTSQSYTVCAWLLHGHQDRMIAVSIGNEHHGAFYLQYNDHEGGFKFATTVSERDPLAIYVVCDAPAPVGEWNHVAGVHDAERHEIRLYVNGRLKGTAPYATPWRVDGSTYFGCCRVMDTFMGHWFGEIDDIRMYDSVLSETELESLYKGGTCYGDGNKCDREEVLR